MRRRGQRGAVYVEFLVAFLPMLIFFECLVQLAGLFTAKLVVGHAATTAVRAAAVVVADDPRYYNDQPVGQATGDRRDAVLRAAAMPLRTVKSVVDVAITFPSSAGGNDDKTSYVPGDAIRVRVDATYRCFVPFASRLVCSFLTGRRQLVGEAGLPYHGADYAYGSSSAVATGPF